MSSIASLSLRQRLDSPLSTITSGVRQVTEGIQSSISQLFEGTVGKIKHRVAGRVFKTIANLSQVATNTIILPPHLSPYAINTASHLTDAIRHTPFLRDKKSRKLAREGRKGSVLSIADVPRDIIRSLWKGLVKNEIVTDHADMGAKNRTFTV